MPVRGITLRQRPYISGFWKIRLNSTTSVRLAAGGRGARASPVYAVALLRSPTASLSLGLLILLSSCGGCRHRPYSKQRKKPPRAREQLPCCLQDRPTTTPTRGRPSSRRLTASYSTVLPNPTPCYLTGCTECCTPLPLCCSWMLHFSPCSPPRLTSSISR